LYLLQKIINKLRYNIINKEEEEIEVERLIVFITLFLITLSSISNASDVKKTVLKISADAVPHTEMLELIRPDLAKQGIELKIYTMTDTTLANSQVSDGELDANFFQHYEYLKAQVKDRNLDLVNAGSIHVEPMGIYSDKYKSIKDLPNNAKIGIINDSTNEYRALVLLEKAGFIKLKSRINPYTASARDIKTYIKPIEIVELDPSLVTRIRDQFGAYITWSSKILEAGIDLQKVKIFSEEGDSPYTNIIAVNSKKVNDPAIKALVKALKSDKMKKFISEQYKGAVIASN
jgi:D-methionine transport system substrate-binding protein